MKVQRPGRVATVNLSIAAVLVLALVVGFVVLHGHGDPATASSVRTATVSEGDVSATVDATGTSGPTSTSEVSFTSSGTIASIRAKVGQRLKKGQVLATLDTEALQTQVDVAQAKLDAAQDQYSAAVASYDDAVAAAKPSSTSSTSSTSTNQNAQSQQSSASPVASASAQLASARAGRLQAENDLQSAQSALDGATLRSPRAGTVLTVNGTVGGSSGGSGTGSSTGTSTGLFTIADLTRMQVSASFAEADAMALKVGQAATSVFNAAQDSPVTGKVTSVAPTPTTANNVVSYAVTVSLPTLPKGLRSGQSATVTVTTGSRTGVLTVPGSAVTNSGTTHTVTVVASGQQTRTVVKVGLEGDQLTQITSGLTAGQQVLLTTASTSSGSGSGFPRGDFPGGGAGGGLVLNGNAPAGGTR